MRGKKNKSGVIPDKISPGKYKLEAYLLSLTISIAVGFSIPILILKEQVCGIDLNLSTVFSVSVLQVDLDLSIDLILSVLLILGVSTVLLDDYNFCFVDCVNLLF